MRFAKQDALGQVAYFSANEVETLLEGLRYFNTAGSDDITPGARSFSVQLVDRATNLSPPSTATLNVMTFGISLMNMRANSGDNLLLAPDGDNLQGGWLGQDSWMGGGGDPAAQALTLNQSQQVL